ncbi:peptidase, partial [Alistipes onderdonkii]
MSAVRKWSRPVHRDLSFFFSGVLLIYAVSGFMLNH